MANYVPIELSPYELRIAMIGNGYHPTPCHGKKPFLSGWQGIFATEEAVRAWGGDNTGGLTKFIPALDIDILDAQAAQIVEDVARPVSEGSDPCPHWPGTQARDPAAHRHAVQKNLRKLVDPDGSTHKIEVLGDGQQLAVAGIHPDTGKPYVWQGGRSPVNTPRAELPPADDVETILDLCVAELKAKLGWTESASVRHPNSTPQSARRWTSASRRRNTGARSASTRRSLNCPLAG